MRWPNSGTLESWAWRAVMPALLLGGNAAGLTLFFVAVLRIVSWRQHHRGHAWTWKRGGIWWLAYFGLQVIGGCWSNDLDAWRLSLEVKSALWFFPVLLAMPGRSVQREFWWSLGVVHFCLSGVAYGPGGMVPRGLGHAWRMAIRPVFRGRTPHLSGATCRGGIFGVGPNVGAHCAQNMALGDHGLAGTFVGVFGLQSGHIVCFGGGVDATGLPPARGGISGRARAVPVTGS